MAARFAHIRKKLENGLPDPRKPLSTPNRERFCQMVAAGNPVPIAYQACGYKGGKDCRSQLRRSADVDQRVTYLVAQRIKSDARERHRREKPIDDMRLRVAKEFERLAFADVRDVVAWERRPVLDADGNVTGFRDEIMPIPSHKLKPSQAAAVKGVTTKSGSLKIELHDKIAALTQMAKILGMMTDATPANVTVNQLNVSQGRETALELARKLAFAIAAAEQAALTAPVIEGEKAE